MIRIGGTDKVMWYLIASAGLPYLFLLYFIEFDLVSLGFLVMFVFLFDWLFVPHYLFSGQLKLWKKVLTIGINLLLSALFIGVTGGANSIFFPHFFLLPILVACVYGGVWESLVTTGLVILCSSYWFAGSASYGILYMIAQSLTLVLISVVLGYVIESERKLRKKNEDLAKKLQTAYEELDSSHQELQAYTNLVEDMNETMEQLAVTDELTMLYNYRYFQEYLESQLNATGDQSLSLIMMDIDHFKQINDKWGHQVGNEVLVKLANITIDTVRDKDVVVRYGGEEFAIILPQVNIEGAYAVAERIRTVVEDTVFCQYNSIELRLTVSLGLTIFPDEADNKSDLISNADKAMYKAKELGRNRIVLYRDLGKNDR